MSKSPFHFSPHYHPYTTTTIINVHPHSPPSLPLQTLTSSLTPPLSIASQYGMTQADRWIPMEQRASNVGPSVYSAAASQWQGTQLVAGLPRPACFLHLLSLFLCRWHSRAPLPLLRIQRDRRICASNHGLPISPLRIMECQLIDSTIRSCGSQQHCLR